MRGQRTALVAGVAAVLAGAILGGGLVLRRAEPAAVDEVALGEARQGSLTVPLGESVGDVAISEARAPGRPIVLVDPGHGGRDPGAIGISDAVREKELTLAFARELRDRLAADGRVRVAMTRTDDRYLTLEQRADLARRIGASLFVSIHMDSAPNPLARGATVYSLSDVASDAEAARFAAAENRAGAGPTSERAADVRSLLTDLALRDQMGQSADLAQRMVDRARGRVLLRPEPHKFAAFLVLRRAIVPGVLFEAGYISNVDDEAALISPAGRAPIVAALAHAIEVDSALRNAR